MHYTRWKRQGHPLAKAWDRFNRWNVSHPARPALTIINRDSGVETTVLFDPADEPLLRRYRWCLNDNGYVITYGTGLRTGASLRGERMHRILLGLEPGDGTVVDHINGNRLDNRRANLRIVPHQLNTSNLEIENGNGSSRYRGVSWDKKSRAWAAYAKVNYRKVHLGKYATEEAAAEAVATFRREQGLPEGY